MVLSYLITKTLVYIAGDAVGYSGSTFGVATATFGGTLLMATGGAYHLSLPFDGPKKPLSYFWTFADLNNSTAGWNQSVFGNFWSVAGSLCYLDVTQSFIMFGGATTASDGSIGLATNVSDISILFLFMLELHMSGGKAKVSFIIAEIYPLSAIRYPLC